MTVDQPISKLVFSLHTDRPGLHELNYNGYARMVANFVDGEWLLDTERVVSTQAQIRFPLMRTGDGIFQVTYFGLSVDGRSPWFFGSLYPSIHVAKGVYPIVIADMEALARSVQTELERSLTPTEVAALRGAVEHAVGYPGREAAIKAIDKLHELSRRKP